MEGPRCSARVLSVCVIVFVCVCVLCCLAGVHWVFSPVLCLASQPLWARVWETFGEVSKGED
jgi:hypothetical protein